MLASGRLKHNRSDRSASPAPAPGGAGGRAPASLSRAQRWVFRLMALILPCLALGAVEVFLRAAGYGYPPSFFLRARVEGREGWVENQRFGWRFFPPAIARTPEPSFLPAPKESNTCRIFILGESAAQGDPEPAFGFWRFLEAMLEARYPGVRFEMVNAAMTAISSPVVREIARDCAGKEGDVWLVLMGNNEVVGPFGAGTVFGPQAPRLAMVRGSLALKSTRAGQWLASLKPQGAAPSAWGGMEMFMNQRVTRDDPRMAVVYESFERNLQDILELGVRSGARVLAATLPCNLKDCAPFGSVRNPALGAEAAARWEALCSEGAALMESGRHAEALAKFEAGVALDGGHAGLVFQQARCELALGREKEARRDFGLSRELDVLRFRSDARIHELTRKAAAQTPGAAFLDAVELFDRSAPGGSPGEELFYEHVHFTPEGNYLLATGVFEKIIPLLPEAVRRAGPASPAAPSFDECARRLALTDWDRMNAGSQVLRRFDEEAPFGLQSNQAERRRHLQERVGKARASLERHQIQARETYDAALRAAPGDWMIRANYAEFLESAGDAPGAMAQWRETLKRAPRNFQAWYRLSELAESAGRHADAEEFLQRAQRLKPLSPEVLNGLGLLRANEGRHDEAAALFQQALRIRPGFGEAEVNWGHSLAAQGRTNEAFQRYESAIKSNSNNAPAHINMGKLLAVQGKSAEALAHYQEAVRAKPESAVAHFNLGNALARLQRYPEALEHYTEAARLQPALAEARQALGLELARSGRPAEAMAQFEELVRLQPQSPDGHLNLGVALARAGRMAEAAREFQTVLKLQPGHPAAQRYLEQAGGLAKP